MIKTYTNQLHFSKFPSTLTLDCKVQEENRGKVEDILFEIFIRNIYFLAEI